MIKGTQGMAGPQPVRSASLVEEDHVGKQLLWRGHISLAEQANGYFQVRAVEFFDGDHTGNEVLYPNLSWAESSDVVEAVLEGWATTRTQHQQTVVGVPWVQLSLID